MELNEYQNASHRTCPDLGSLKLNVAHMIMGMVSELEELFEAIDKGDIVNIGEELTDQYWYLSNYCRYFNISFEDLDFENVIQLEPIKGIEDLLMRITKSISKLTDVEKKSLAYNKEVNAERRLDFCKDIFRMIKLTYTYFSLNMYKCMENNIQKLRIRFPDKFTEKHAINRDLENERKALEA